MAGLTRLEYFHKMAGELKQGEAEIGNFRLSVIPLSLDVPKNVRRKFRSTPKLPDYPCRMRSGTDAKSISATK